MGIDIKESMRIAKQFKDKKANGEKLSKGEEIILTLAAEFAKIVKQDFRVSNELCVDIISVQKKRMSDTSKTSLVVDDMELNMLLDGLLERLFIH